MLWNTPNILTLLRIALIPVFLFFFYWLPTDWHRVAAAGIFILASVTDWLDGYLARKLQQQSAFGAFLDPVADKLIVAFALVVIVQSNPDPWIAIPAGIIIAREITVSALREWMAEVGERAKVAVSWVGKWKTTVQMLAIIGLIYDGPLRDPGRWLLYVAAVLTLYSMISYLRAAWPVVSRKP